VRDALDGVGTGMKDPVPRAAPLVTGCVAGFLLPVVPLPLPLTAREEHWSAGWTPALRRAESGVLGVTFTVMVRGAGNRPGPTAGAGVPVAAVGLGVPGSVPAAAVPSAVPIGMGSGLFASRIGPLALTSAPHSHLSRTQALLTLVRSVSLPAMNNVLGNVARPAGPATAVLACAAAMAAPGTAALRSRAPRTTTTAPPALRPSEDAERDRRRTGLTVTSPGENHARRR
jgi:hypothetical protein